MRGYVERQEWLQRFSDEPVGYDEVMDSYLNDADSAEIDAPKRPSRGLCTRCLRTLPVASLNGNHCTDRHDCSKALLALIKHRKGSQNG